MKKKLVILSDYGLDDACATAYILENRNNFSGIDIVAIGGNTSAKNSLDNIKKLLQNYVKENGENATDGIRLIETTALRQQVCTLPSIHGIDGMGDLFADIVQSPVPMVSFEQFLDELVAKDIILFSVGPCTITKIILDKIGECELVIMAGVIDEVPNFRDMEFNQGLDAAAYDYCVGFKHVIATLDSCRKPCFNLAGKRIKGKSLLAKLVNRAEEFAEARHPDNCYIYDYVAAKYLIEPQLFNIVVKTDKWGNTLSNLEPKE